jgi:hypothetical protein
VNHTSRPSQPSSWDRAGTLRRAISETTNSLSVSDRAAPSWGSSLVVTTQFSRHSGSGASLTDKLGAVYSRAPSLTADPRPSRITRKSYRPRVSDRTMVGTGPPFCFAGFRTDWLRREQPMKTAGRGNPNNWAYSAQHPSPCRGSSEQISLDHVGWDAGRTPAAGDVLFLDVPLYRTCRDLSRGYERLRPASRLCSLAVVRMRSAT